jgi:hypothetical protein
VPQGPTDDPKLGEEQSGDSFQRFGQSLAISLWKRWRTNFDIS